MAMIRNDADATNPIASALRAGCRARLRLASRRQRKRAGQNSAAGAGAAALQSRPTGGDPGGEHRGAEPKNAPACASPFSPRPRSRPPGASTADHAATQRARDLPCAAAAGGFFGLSGKQSSHRQAAQVRRSVQQHGEHRHNTPHGKTNHQAGGRPIELQKRRRHRGQPPGAQSHQHQPRIAQPGQPRRSTPRQRPRSDLRRPAADGLRRVEKPTARSTPNSRLRCSTPRPKQQRHQHHGRRNEKHAEAEEQQIERRRALRRGQCDSASPA